MSGADLLSVSVYGERGVVDLLVPAALPARAVGEEYARQTEQTGATDQTGATSSPVRLVTRTGVELDPASPLPATLAGAVLVALAGDGRPESSAAGLTAASDPGAGATTRATATQPVRSAPALVAVALALSAAATAGRTSATDETVRLVVAGLLLIGALSALVPSRRPTGGRVLAAPALAAAAVWAVAPPVLDPQLVGALAAGAAAVTAAAALAVSRHGRAGLLVWLVGGILAGALLAGAHLLGAPPAAVGSLVLVAGLFAVRVAPAWVVTAPSPTASEPSDHDADVAVDLPGDIVGAVRHGQRLLGGIGVGIGVGLTLAAFALAGTEQPQPDRLGTGLLLVLVAVGAPLGAAGHRNAVARQSLRLGGLAAALAAVWSFAPQWSTDTRSWVLTTSLSAGAVAVATAVAAGQGWRSVWWARRAELAEALVGALAVGAAVVSSGLFRLVWELASR